MLFSNWADLGRVVGIGPLAYLVKAEPTLLLHNGRHLDGALKAQRVTRAEVQAALRAHGEPGAEGVTAVVLETDGTLTVISGGRVGTGALDFRGMSGPATARPTRAAAR